MFEIVLGRFFIVLGIILGYFPDDVWENLGIVLYDVQVNLSDHFSCLAFYSEVSAFVSISLPVLFASVFCVASLWLHVPKVLSSLPVADRAP